MAALGIEDDSPPLPEMQKPLRNGIHLRWNYGQHQGFPWYGVHLLRRHSRNDPPVCLGNSLYAGQTLFADDALSSERGTLSSTADLKVVPGLQGKPAIALTDGNGIDFRHIDERPMVEIVLRVYFSGTGSIRITCFSGTEIAQTELLENKQSAATSVQYRPVEYGITRITLFARSLAAPALIDLCFTPCRLLPNEDWSLVPDFSYPLALPVHSASYPCSTAPVSFDEALKMVKARSLQSVRRIEAEFREFHRLLQVMVDRGPSHGATSEIDVDYSIADPATGGQNTMRFRVHDLLMLAALDAQVARILGLYWEDGSAGPGIAYDYLLLPDYIGDLHQTPAQDIPAAIANMPWTHIVDKGFISYNQSLKKQPPLAAPDVLKGWALPGTGVAESLQKVVNRFNNAGLYWQAPKLSHTGEIAALFHVWRGGPGNPQETSPTGSHLGDPQLLTKEEPIVVGKPESIDTATYPPGWPKHPMHKIDSGLADGQYAYYVSAIDLFGRHSGLSRPVTVKLIDKVLPPPPTGVEAWLLDPADKWITQDKAYHDWRAGLTESQKDEVIGLRIKWRWPAKTHSAAAPDVEEFRIYLHDGLFNTRFGNVAKVKKARAGTSYITTDLASTEADDVYHGSRLTSDNRVYTVVSSRQRVGRLELEIKNHRDAHLNPVISPTSGTEFSLALSDQNDKADPPFADATDPKVWGAPLKQNIACRDGQEHYEIFLTIAANKLDGRLLSAPTLSNPVVYGQVAVTAVRKKTLQSRIAAHPRVVRILRDKPEPPSLPYPDGKAYTATMPDYHNRSYFTYHWADQPHQGLQSHVFRALDETLYQTDWERDDNGFAKIDPAEDFPPEWKTEAGLVGQVTTEIEHIHRLPRGAASKEQELAATQALAHYRGLSNNALRALAGLRGNEAAYTQITTEPYNEATNQHKDHLEGRTQGRYFYRACFVDKAHNRSRFGAASPPVLTPGAAEPQAPSFSRLEAGDREITLFWNASPDPGVDLYRIYHTSHREKARDIRLMGEPVVEIPAPNRFELEDETEFSQLDQVYWIVPVNESGEELAVQAPDAISAIAKSGNKWGYKIAFSVNRNAGFSEYLVYRLNHADSFAAIEKAEFVGSVSLEELSWTKAGIPPKTVNYFRIAAVDKDTNQSDTTLAAGMSVALSAPEPPAWKSAKWIENDNRDNVIALRWETMESEGQCLLQRRSEFDSDWISLAGWMSSDTPHFSYVDATVDETRYYEYRLIFMDSAGMKSTWFENRGVEPLFA